MRSMLPLALLALAATGPTAEAAKISMYSASTCTGTVAGSAGLANNQCYSGSVAGDASSPGSFQVKCTTSDATSAWEFDVYAATGCSGTPGAVKGTGTTCQGNLMVDCSLNVNGASSLFAAPAMLLSAIAATLAAFRLF